MSRKLASSQIWGAPIALGVLSSLGLVAALLSDGAGDWAAWLTLAAPVAVCAWYSRPRR